MDRKGRCYWHLIKGWTYGGTYAQKDIAFEFASWISVEFKLYLIKEFQRLEEKELQPLGRNIKRNLSKERLVKLNELAIKQMRVLLNVHPILDNTIED